MTRMVTKNLRNFMDCKLMNKKVMIFIYTLIQYSLLFFCDIKMNIQLFQEIN